MKLLDRLYKKKSSIAAEQASNVYSYKLILCCYNAKCSFRVVILYKKKKNVT